MGKSLKNPPVYLTLVQVRFNTVLTLAEEYLSTIQEKFRLANFPDYKIQSIMALQFATQDGKSVPTPVPMERFQFGNNERTHLFTLDNQSLSLQSTRYGDFETFSKIYLDGLKIINDIVRLAYYDRIGLRYLDRIMPKENESVEQYLVESAHGMMAQLGGKSVYSYTESMHEFGPIKLLSRIVIQEGVLAPPPDIQLANMEIDPRFMSHKGVNATLDNDGFIEQRELFSIDSIKDHLAAIHQVTSSAFKATVRDDAFQVWDQ